MVVVVDRLRTGDEETKKKGKKGENKLRKCWICFGRNIGFSKGNCFAGIGKMPHWNTNYEHEKKKTNLSLTVNNTQEKSIMQHTHRHTHTHTHPQNRAKGTG